MNDEKSMAGNVYLIEIITNFFKYTPEGISGQKALLEFIEMHIEALERHDQPVHLKNSLIAFVEDISKLNNIESTSVKSLLRKQMAAPHEKPFL